MTQTARKKKVNTVILIIIAVCVALGYYAWRQQQRALAGLQQLKDSGVQVAFSLHSRPLLAVDVSKQYIYLLDGSASEGPTRLAIAAIRQITFTETPVVSTSENPDPRGPDTLTIVMNDGSEYRVGDLPGGASGAQQAMQQFQQQQIPKQKLLFKPR